MYFRKDISGRRRSGIFFCCGGGVTKRFVVFAEVHAGRREHVQHGNSRLMVDDALKALYRRRDIAGMDQTFGFAQGSRRGRDGFRHLSSYLSLVVASHPATWSLRGQKKCRPDTTTVPGRQRGGGFTRGCGGGGFGGC